MALKPEGSPSLFGYRLGNAIPGLDGMPLLRDFVEERKGAQPLEGVTALLIQHQLCNQGPQVDALVQLGLKPNRIFWLDIPYTSSERFRRTMQERHGIPEKNFWVSRYNVLEPYSAHQFRRTQEAFLHFLRKPPERLLVLDDGAYFLEAAMAFRKQLPHIAVVEQTTRGVTKIEESAALTRYCRGYTVINVARSTPKLELESPWIGTAVLLALTRHLRDLARRSPQFAVKRDSPCLVLGYGAVGRQVAAHLRRIANVYVFDTKRSQLDLAVRDGFAAWDPLDQINAPEPLEFKLVVGCTGRASFGVGDHGFLDRHAILASASSGSVELSRNDFIDLAASSHGDDIRVKTGRLVPDRIHQTLRMQLVDRSVVFLNAGFPINFDGRLNCIPWRYMQPTAMLMVHGAIQALNTSARGLVDVDSEFCDDLTAKFRSSLNEAELEALGHCSTELASPLHHMPD
jgi:S-adenosylhomocysteine hydrolase